MEAVTVTGTAGVKWGEEITYLARMDNRKKLVKQQYLPTYLHNTVNFGPLAAEIGSVVWGTPSNFNWFRVLASLLQ